MGRFNNNQFLNNSNNFQGDIENNYIANAGIYNVYKFRKVGGITQLSSQGENDLSFNSNQSNQQVNIYNGKEPINVVWENSTKLSVVDGKIIKTMQVGTYYQLQGNSPYSKNTTNESIDIFGSNYITEMVEDNFSFTSPDWEPTKDDMLKYFYLVIDKKSPSYQWLELSSATPFFNEITGKQESTLLSFSSINLKYATTGKKIIDFIQVGAPKESYAFPRELPDGSVVLDEDKKFNNTGVARVQLDYLGGAAISDLMFIGRKKNILQEDGTEIVSHPQFLLPYKTYLPSSSNFIFNQPNYNSFAIVNGKASKISIWDSYKKAPNTNNNIGSYNINETKEVLTGINADDTAVKASNPIVNDVYSIFNWKDDVEIPVLINNAFEPIPYIKNSNEINRVMNYTDFLAMNYFINFTTDVFNFDYTELKKYKLTDTLGVFGSLVDFLVGGLDIGWTSSTNLSSKGQALNLLIPCISYLDAKNALDELAPIPMDIFNDNNSQKVIAVNSNVLTSWNVGLTDRIIDTSNIVNNAPLGKGGNGVWDTIYMGQSKDENGANLFPDGRTLLINWEIAMGTTPSEASFILDEVLNKVIASCDVKFTCFDLDGNSIYYSMFETTAKAFGDMRLWSNKIKLNYYGDFNTSGKLDWPNSPTPPTPPTPSNKVPIDLAYLSQISIPIREINNSANINDNFAMDTPWNFYAEESQSNGNFLVKFKTETDFNVSKNTKTWSSDINQEEIANTEFVDLSAYSSLEITFGLTGTTETFKNIVIYPNESGDYDTTIDIYLRNDDYVNGYPAYAALNDTSPKNYLHFYNSFNGLLYGLNYNAKVSYNFKLKREAGSTNLSRTLQPSININNLNVWCVNALNKQYEASFSKLPLIIDLPKAIYGIYIKEAYLIKKV